MHRWEFPSCSQASSRECETVDSLTLFALFYGGVWESFHSVRHSSLCPIFSAVKPDFCLRTREEIKRRTQQPACFHHSCSCFCRCVLVLFRRDKIRRNTARVCCFVQISDHVALTEMTLSHITGRFLSLLKVTKSTNYYIFHHSF